MEIDTEKILSNYRESSQFVQNHILKLDSFFEKTHVICENFERIFKSCKVNTCTQTSTVKRPPTQSTSLQCSLQDSLSKDVKNKFSLQNTCTQTSTVKRPPTQSTSLQCLVHGSLSKDVKNKFTMQDQSIQTSLPRYIHKGKENTQLNQPDNLDNGKKKIISHDQCIQTTLPREHGKSNQNNGQQCSDKSKILSIKFNSSDLDHSQDQAHVTTKDTGQQCSIPQFDLDNDSHQSPGLLQESNLDITQCEDSSSIIFSCRRRDATSVCIVNNDELQTDNNPKQCISKNIQHTSPEVIASDEQNTNKLIKAKTKMATKKSSKKISVRSRNSKPKTSRLSIHRTIKLKNVALNLTRVNQPNMDQYKCRKEKTKAHGVETITLQESCNSVETKSNCKQPKNTTCIKDKHSHLQNKSLHNNLLLSSTPSNKSQAIIRAKLVRSIDPNFLCNEIENDATLSQGPKCSIEALKEIHFPLVKDIDNDGTYIANEKIKSKPCIEKKGRPSKKSANIPCIDTELSQCVSRTSQGINSPKSKDQSDSIIHIAGNEEVKSKPCIKKRGRLSKKSAYVPLIDTELNECLSRTSQGIDSSNCKDQCEPIIYNADNEEVKSKPCINKRGRLSKKSAHVPLIDTELNECLSRTSQGIDSSKCKDQSEPIIYNADNKEVVSNSSVQKNSRPMKKESSSDNKLSTEMNQSGVIKKRPKKKRKRICLTMPKSRPNKRKKQEPQIMISEVKSTTPIDNNPKVKLSVIKQQQQQQEAAHTLDVLDASYYEDETIGIVKKRLVYDIKEDEANNIFEEVPDVSVTNNMSDKVDDLKINKNKTSFDANVASEAAAVEETTETSVFEMKNDKHSSVTKKAKRKKNIRKRHVKNKEVQALCEEKPLNDKDDLMSIMDSTDVQNVNKISEKKRKQQRKPKKQNPGKQNSTTLKQINIESEKNIANIEKQDSTTVKQNIIDSEEVISNINPSTRLKEPSKQISATLKPNDIDLKDIIPDINLSANLESMKIRSSITTIENGHHLKSSELEENLPVGNLILSNKDISSKINLKSCKINIKRIASKLVSPPLNNTTGTSEVNARSSGNKMVPSTKDVELNNSRELNNKKSELKSKKKGQKKYLPKPSLDKKPENSSETFDESVGTNLITSNLELCNSSTTELTNNEHSIERTHQLPNVDKVIEINSEATNDVGLREPNATLDKEVDCINEEKVTKQSKNKGKIRTTKPKISKLKVTKKNSKNKKAKTIITASPGLNISAAVNRLIESTKKMKKHSRNDTPNKSLNNDHSVQQTGKYVKPDELPIENVALVIDQTESELNNIEMNSRPTISQEASSKQIDHTENDNLLPDEVIINDDINILSRKSMRISMAPSLHAICESPDRTISPLQSYINHCSTPAKDLSSPISTNNSLQNQTIINVPLDLLMTKPTAPVSDKEHAEKIERIVNEDKIERVGRRTRISKHMANSKMAKVFIDSPSPNASSDNPKTVTKAGGSKPTKRNVKALLPSKQVSTMLPPLTKRLRLSNNSSTSQSQRSLFNTKENSMLVSSQFTDKESYTFNNTTMATSHFNSSHAGTGMPVNLSSFLQSFNPNVSSRNRSRKSRMPNNKRS